MKKIVVFFFSLLFGATAWAQERTSITKFEGETLTGLIVGGAFEVKLSQGSPASVRIEVPTESVEKLSCERTDEGFVRIGYGSEMGKYFTLNKNRPTAYVTLSRLDYLAVSGNCTVLGESTFSSRGNFVLTVTGAAFCDALIVESEGANVSVEGGAKVDNLRLVCADKSVVSVSGSAVLTLSGSAPSARLSASSMAQFNALNFACAELQVSATGTSLLKIHVSGSADVTTGGMAGVRYTGSGKITGSGAKPL